MIMRTSLCTSLYKCSGESLANVLIPTPVVFYGSRCGQLNIPDCYSADYSPASTQKNFNKHVSFIFCAEWNSLARLELLSMLLYAATIPVVDELCPWS
jgi:hypothetical protein